MLYYQLLEVAVNASQEDIKKKFHELAKKYHPDRHPGNKEFAELFQKITAAYDVLSDPVKRSVYNAKNRINVVPPHQKRQPYRKPQEATKPPRRIFKSPIINVERTWNDNWDQPPSIRELSRIQCEYLGDEEEGRSVLVRVPVSDEELANGTIKIIEFKKRIRCGCSGKKSYCMECHGNIYTHWKICVESIYIEPGTKRAPIIRERMGESARNGFAIGKLIIELC